MKYIIILIILAVFLIGCTSVKVPPKEQQCTSDYDCAAAECCHASECVPAADAPDCSGIFCTQECVPGTMDCGQGYCACADGVCKAVFE